MNSNVYHGKTLRITSNQEKRLISALKSGTGCVIKIYKANENAENVDKTIFLDEKANQISTARGLLHLRPEQISKIDKAKPGSTIALKFSKEDLEYNRRSRGGFIPLLLAALAPVLGGVAGGLIEKEIAGSGLSPPPSAGKKRKHAPAVAPPPPPVEEHNNNNNKPGLLWYRSDSAFTRKGVDHKKPYVFSVRPDASGEGLHLAPFPLGYGLKKRFIAGGRGLYLSPYHHGGGLGKHKAAAAAVVMKMDDAKPISPSRFGHFSSKQRKAVHMLTSTAPPPGKSTVNSSKKKKEESDDDEDAMDEDESEEDEEEE